MSEIVHYKGTAKMVDLKGQTSEEFALEYIKTQGKEIPSYYDNAVEYLVERWSNYFFFYHKNQSLYEITRVNVDLDDEIIKAEFDSTNDNINYELRYYNGGAGFEECLEEAFDKINLH